jgi:hypothetical protein
MPTYSALATSGIFCLSASCPSGGSSNIQVFAGTVDDPFFIDLGATFDSINFRMGSSFLGTGGILSPLQDSTDTQNYAADMLSGFNVNTIALQVPISMLITGAGNPVIGTWAATFRPAMTVRNAPSPITTSGSLQQVNRLGNPLINELIIGTGSKDTYSMSQPSGDSTFAPFFLDPTLAHVFNAVYLFTVPDPPRKDLLPLASYIGPTIPVSTKPGPVADLLRLNTAILPTSPGCATTRRLGVLGGDLCGFPNGRRLADDVVDIAMRAVAGALCGTPVNLYPAGTTPVTEACTAAGVTFNGTTVSLLGDGVNLNDVPLQGSFPYVAFSQSGYTRLHHNPGDKACGQASTQVTQVGQPSVTTYASTCPTQ